MMSAVMTVMITLSFFMALLSGNISGLSGAFMEGCGDAVELALSLTGIICLWSGLMRVAQATGLTETLAKAFEPLLCRLFKGLKKGGKAIQFITLNLTANLLGLGNASTPFGLAAMKEIELEERSKEPEKASHNMIIFAVMNTASLQLIPTTAAALRLQHGSAAPMEILPCVWIASFVSLFTALLAAGFFKKLSGNKRITDGKNMTGSKNIINKKNMTGGKNAPSDKKTPDIKGSSGGAE